MQSEPLPELLGALDVVVLQEQSDRSFRSWSRAPEWFLLLCPEAGARGTFRPQDRLQFLEHFLVDAQVVWDSSSPGRKTSGVWTERGPDGEDLVLQAMALLLGENRILLVERLGEEFQQRREIIQRARGKALESQALLRAAEALRAHADRVSEVLGSIPDTMFRVRRDGSYLDFGAPARHDPTGSPSRPRHIDEILPKSVAKQFMNQVEECLDGDSIRIVEYRAAVEGEERDLEARIAVCGDGEVLVIVRDVTERKLQETELGERLRLIRSSRDDLMLILNQLRLGTALMDAEGRIVFLSQPAQRLFALNQKEVLGKRWKDIPKLRDLDLEGVRQMSRRPPGERSRVPVHWERQDGRQYWMEVDVQDDPGSTERKIYFFYDVSEVHDLRRLLDEKGHYEDIVGKSKPMQRVFHLIRDLSQVDATVLIEGETGTGKELVARAIHSSSHRKGRPFVAVNCAGLTESLVASQLFGHRRGAFTGAVEDQRGLFEAADGGILFLDEIGDIPPSIQTNLLRVLQEKEITRVGDTMTRKVDVRILTATHKNLTEEVATGYFRPDLLYRIRVARILIPPLRERLEDVPLLVIRFLGEIRAATGKPVQEISADAMRVLMGYPWPGNVRELRSAIEFAAIRSGRTVIGPEDLPPELLEGELQARGSIKAVDPKQREKERIITALQKARGNRKLAAQMLGIGRATLYRRLASLEINPDD